MNMLGEGKIESVAEEGAEITLMGEDGRIAILPTGRARLFSNRYWIKKTGLNTRVDSRRCAGYSGTFGKMTENLLPIFQMGSAGSVATKTPFSTG